MTRTVAPLALFILLAPNLAVASPWTLPADRIAVIGGFDYGFANQEWLDEGGVRGFPLRGNFTSSTFSIGTRFGFTDRLEFSAQLPITLVSYDADAVILLPAPGADPGADFDYYQQNIIELTQTARGVGDLRVAGRYRWFLQPFALATEVEVKAPTGYRGPSGTFGDRPQTAEEFLADPGRFVRPENIQDDVTLGDGQLDVAVSMLFGYVFPTNTFVRLDAGYNLRLSGAADQVVGSVRLGQVIAPGLLAFVGARGAYSIEDGRVIGISVTAEDPELPAAEYAGLNNLGLREVRLYRDRLAVDGGVIIRLAPGVELNLGYGQTVWGRNTALVRRFSASIAMSTSIAEEDDE
ncbi:MAG: hypothetical protein RMA76_21260 [Deltaproteobacteria bacterium]|jgi:hypothetical protein